MDSKKGAGVASTNQVVSKLHRSNDKGSMGNIRAKEFIKGIKLLSPSHGHQQVIDCRLYVGRSAKSSRVYACVWVHAPKAPEYLYTHGYAGGWGYDKKSAAVWDALNNAGFAFRADFSGRGMDSAVDALRSVAEYYGYDDCIVVEMAGG